MAALFAELIFSTPVTTKPRCFASARPVRCYVANITVPQIV
jgi:hypothetical protein